MNVQALKTQLTLVMPILDANLAAAYKEYMAGDLSAGAYGYVRARHEQAHLVLASNDPNALAAYESCALLAIDLHSGINEMADKKHAIQHVEDWWQCYRDAGFTHIHKHFDSPTLPGPFPRRSLENGNTRDELTASA